MGSVAESCGAERLAAWAVRGLARTLAEGNADALRDADRRRP